MRWYWLALGLVILGGIAVGTWWYWTDIRVERLNDVLVDVDDSLNRPEGRLDGLDTPDTEPPTGTLDQGLPPNDADAGFPPTSSTTPSSNASATDQSSSSNLSSDEPPLLLKSIGFTLDTYDPATNRAGDFQFTKQKLQFDRLLMGYGFHIPAEQTGGGQAKDNPQPTFILPLGTKVRSLVGGVVTEIPTVWSGDYSIHVTDGKNEQWRYETEHVINPVVKVGDRVTAGQIIAEVSDYDTGLPAGFGLFEIGILHGGQTPEHVCPFAYLDPSIKVDVQAKLLQFYKDWEAYKGHDSLYTESESPIGCLTLDPIEG